jgi:hypothetical protein
MVVRSPAEFVAAVAAHPFGEFAFEPEALSSAAASVAKAGLLVVGEPHGVRETPSVLYALELALGTRAVAVVTRRDRSTAAGVPVQRLVRVRPALVPDAPIILRVPEATPAVVPCPTTI